MVSNSWVMRSRPQRHLERLIGAKPREMARNGFLDILVKRVENMTHVQVRR